MTNLQELKDIQIDPAQWERAKAFIDSEYNCDGDFEVYKRGEVPDSVHYANCKGFLESQIGLGELGRAFARSIVHHCTSAPAEITIEWDGELKYSCKVADQVLGIMRADKTTDFPWGLTHEQLIG